MEIVYVVLLITIAVMLAMIHDRLRELCKANREPRKAVIVPSQSAAWPNREFAERQAEMERGTLQASAVGRPRMTSSEFSEAAREENLRLAREEAIRAERQ